MPGKQTAKLTTDAPYLHVCKANPTQGYQQGFRLALRHHCIEKGLPGWSILTRPSLLPLVWSRPCPSLAEFVILDCLSVHLLVHGFHTVQDQFSLFWGDTFCGGGWYHNGAFGERLSGSRFGALSANHICSPGLISPRVQRKYLVFPA